MLIQMCLFFWEHNGVAGEWNSRRHTLRKSGSLGLAPEKIRVTDERQSRRHEEPYLQPLVNWQDFPTKPSRTESKTTDVHFLIPLVTEPDQREC